MKNPLWMEPLARSLDNTKTKPESRFFQLATVDTEGLPQCRTLVFRGFSDHQHVQFITDTRSEKWEALVTNPKVAVCWYFAETREQYRMNGTAHIGKGDQQQTVLMWKNLSNAGKKQFLWGAPMQPRKSDYILDVELEDIPELPPSHFVVINIEVESVDFLTLRGDPQTRILYTQSTDGNWQSKNIIP